MMLKYALKIFLILTLVKSQKYQSCPIHTAHQWSECSQMRSICPIIPKEARYKHNYRYNIQNQNKMDHTHKIQNQKNTGLLDPTTIVSLMAIITLASFITK